MLRVRSFSESKSNKAFVLQCLDCGKQVKAVPGSSVEDHASVQPFDEAIYRVASQARNAWLRQRSQFLESALAAVSVKNDYGRGLVSGAGLTFHTYYDSPEWGRTRGRIFQRDGGRCQACNRPADVVHHMLYDRLGCEHDADLIALCHRCHAEVHSRQDRMHGLLKLTPAEIMVLWGSDGLDLSHYFTGIRLPDPPALPAVTPDVIL